MQRNQISLTEKPVDQNREFLSLFYRQLGVTRRSFEDERRVPAAFQLYYTGYYSGATQKGFEKAGKVPDADMTLEKYLGLMTDPFTINLQTGSPFPAQITYYAGCHVPVRYGGKEVRVARIECQYNQHNYGIVAELFKRAYGVDIESIPVSDQLRRYHEQFKALDDMLNTSNTPVELKPENQRKVIHVADLKSGDMRTLNEVQREFWAQRPGHRLSVEMQDSATYLFQTVEDTQYFGQLLDKRNVPHSYHPAKEYTQVATRGMNALELALFQSIHR